MTREIEPWTALLASARGDGRLVGEAFEHARAPRFEALPAELHPQLQAALRAAGIERLYSHQAAALEAAWRGPTIVTTGTASGKSLCFNLPALDTLLRDPKARALYLYPTKALAQDQARALAALGLHDAIRPAIYDGDTAREARADIRRKANLILTNPDMLHLGILPNHDAWSTLFANLAVVVVDEAHIYRGVFGSHVANVLRRLRRIAAAYGTQPRFLLASATIANPLELAQRLTGLEEVALIDDDGSPSAGRRIAIWNPPVSDEVLGVRRSALAEGAELLAGLVAAGARTICFVRSRKGVELLAKITRDELERLGAGELGELVTPYRAGYTAAQRREIEARLVAGEVRAVVTTDALELGIDVGALDAAVVVTFPGTIASLRQMWGRAGRRRRGFACYVAGEDALDQFFARHTEDFLDRPVESAILDHESEEIHLAHLLCAAHEGPLGERDAEFFGPRTLAYLERLEGLGELRAKDGQFVLRRRERYPAGEVSLRSASRDAFEIVDVGSGEALGTAEFARAFSTLHPGAVYLHLGRSFHVRELDLDARRDERLERNVAAGLEEHVVHERREVGLGDLRRLLHRARGEPYLASADRAAVRHFELHPFALDGIAVLDGHAGMLLGKVAKLGPALAGVVEPLGERSGDFWRQHFKNLVRGAAGQLLRNRAWRLLCLSVPLSLNSTNSSESARPRFWYSAAKCAFMMSNRPVLVAIFAISLRPAPILRTACTNPASARLPSAMQYSSHGMARTRTPPGGNMH